MVRDHIAHERHENHEKGLGGVVERKTNKPVLKKIFMLFVGKNYVGTPA